MEKEGVNLNFLVSEFLHMFHLSWRAGGKSIQRNPIAPGVCFTAQARPSFPFAQTGRAVSLPATPFFCFFVFFFFALSKFSVPFPGTLLWINSFVKIKDIKVFPLRRKRWQTPGLADPES